MCPWVLFLLTLLGNHLLIQPLSTYGTSWVYLSLLWSYLAALGSPTLTKVRPLPWAKPWSQTVWSWPSASTREALVWGRLLWGGRMDCVVILKPDWDKQLQFQTLLQISFLSAECPSGSSDTLCVPWGEPWLVCSFLRGIYLEHLFPQHTHHLYLHEEKQVSHAGLCYSWAHSFVKGQFTWYRLASRTWQHNCGSLLPLSFLLFSYLQAIHLSSRPWVLAQVDAGETTGLWWWQFLEFLPGFNTKLSQSNCAIQH